MDDALALTQVHHGSRLSDSCEGGEALSSDLRAPALLQILIARGRRSRLALLEILIARQNKASLTARWHDKGTDWRGLAHSEKNSSLGTLFWR